MAYDLPTAADLITRYPAFADVAVETIDLHISDASSGADTSWVEADYAPAIAALAAHNMALLGIGAQGEVAGYARAGVTRIRSGNFDASFSEGAVVKASSGSFEATPYGRIYKVLLQRNRGGPRVVVGRVTADDAYPGPMFP